MTPLENITARLAELTKLADGVLPGPWSDWKNYAGDDFANCRIAAPSHKRVLFIDGDTHPEERAIALGDFIAASRTALPALVESLRIAAEALAEVERTYCVERCGEAIAAISAKLGEVAR